MSVPDGERVTTGSEPRWWRVGSHYGIHIYEQAGPEKSDADIPVATALTADFARQIVDAHNRVVEPGHDEQTEDEERAEIADAAYMKGRADALGPPLSTDEIAERREVWMPIERALVAQDRIAGPSEENHDPHVTQAAQPEDVAREVLRAAEPKLRQAPEPWQPDPRTVAAVVEALQEEYANTTVCGDFKKAIDLIEERFKPSAPGGDDGH